MNFLALDFETANHYRSSACAVGLAKIKNNKIVEKYSFLIKPPQKEFYFSYIHGIRWVDVKNEKSFDKLWPKINKLVSDVDYLVAHNASFDKSVLKKCCEYYGIEIPKQEFLCTVQISRNLWNIHPTTLPNVCNHFKIPLKHHDALSDTEACAQILLHALKEKRFKL